MTRFSYHISHEQFAPSELLRFVCQAENAGFDAAFSSDHLQPWSSTQGHSGFAWTWLGAALQATRRLNFGLITVPGGWRYHPVILAQAIATVAEMFPRRLPWVAFGSGEAINERVTGAIWPDKQERNARLREGVEIIRALLAGETVTRCERIPTIEAKIWSRQPQPIRLIGAATSESTAEWLGCWADGLLTVGDNIEVLRQIVTAFRRGGGANKPIYLKVDLSWARTEAEALQQAYDEWRFSALGGDVNWELSRPADFERAARFIRPDDMRQCVCISADLSHHVSYLRKCMELGFESIDLHNVGRNQGEFIDVFSREVLPELRGK